MKNKPPIVSVVIVTLNEEKHIGNCLKSIIAQTYPRDRLEIIVVDNASTDRTVLIAKKYTRKVYNKGPQRSAQRNYGHSKATGEFFLYLDADMSLSPKVIKSCVQHMTSHPSLTGLYIPEIVAGNSYWSRVRRFERSFYDATVIDCVRFIKKSAFVEVGGFDESMTGPEDWDLDKKLRNIGKVALIKTPIHHNEAEFNLKKLVENYGKNGKFLFHAFSVFGPREVVDFFEKHGYSKKDIENLVPGDRFKSLEKFINKFILILLWA